MDMASNAIRSKSLHKQLLIGLAALVLSAFVYLPNLSNPPRPYWDEYYYLSAVQRHVAGNATYASHPPLGLMLLAAGAKFVGDNKNVDTRALAASGKITDQDVPDDYSFFGIRLPSAIAAVLGGVLFCMILLRLGLNGYAAFSFSTLYIFENAFVIQFRSAHLDSFQIAFVLAALLAWLRKDEAALSWRDYAVFGACLGLAVCVKTNAAVLLLIPAVAVLREVWIQHGRRLATIRGAVCSGAVLGAFLAACLSVFTLNFALSPHPPDQTEAGRHDLEQMGPAYQAYLYGRTGLTLGAWEEAITGYVIRMRNDFSGIKLGDPNGQAPLTWPFYTKPVSYRWDSDGGFTQYSTMVGNPVGWRLSIVGVFLGLGLIALRRLRTFPPLVAPGTDSDFAKLETVTLAYAVFLATHAYLGLFRVMYVYHHFIGLILGFLALALSFKILLAAFPTIAKREHTIVAVLSLAVALGFWFYAPFSYHRPIAQSNCELRNIPVAQFNCVGVEHSLF